MLKRALWVLVALALVAGGWWWASRPEPVAVRLHTVDRGTVEATASNTRAGTVTACRRAKLSPSISGQIVRLPFREGAQVAEGAILVELWNDDIRAEQALTREELKAAQAQARASCALAAQAEREAARLTRLRPGGLVSEDVVDKAQAQAASQRAQCNASQAQVDVVQARFATLDARLERTIVRAPFDGVIAELNGELFEITAVSYTHLTLPTKRIV